MKGILRTSRSNKRLRWDEQKLQETEAGKDATMAIEEPKTPYQRPTTADSPGLLSLDHADTQNTRNTCNTLNTLNTTSAGALNTASVSDATRINTLKNAQFSASAAAVVFDHQALSSKLQDTLLEDDHARSFAASRRKHYAMERRRRPSDDDG